MREPKVSTILPTSLRPTKGCSRNKKVRTKVSPFLLSLISISFINIIIALMILNNECNFSFSPLSAFIQYEELLSLPSTKILRITRTCVSSKGFCIFNLLKQFYIIVYCSGIRKSHQESVDIHVIDIRYIYSLIFSFLVTPYYKNKLKGLYKTAMQDAELEAEYDVLYLIQEEIKLITIL